MLEEIGSFVETNVLQMVFDNSKFDRRIAKSTKNAEDFKKAMDFEETSRGLNKFVSSVNNLSFDRLFSNIEALTSKFTGIGDVSEYVISRIRAGFDSIAQSAERFIKSISIDQVVRGKEKYDALNKAVMTVTSSKKPGTDRNYTEEEAYAIFDRLMTYTDETSYSFENMATQISNFTSVGQGLAASERAMEGIANLSAKAGQGTSEASQAMVVFSKAVGAGYLDLQKWQSLNLSHITIPEFRQALIDTALETGDLVKKDDKLMVAAKHLSASGKSATSAESKAIVELNHLESTLHYKWATSEVLMKALDKYYFEEIDNPDANWDTFAGSAAKAAQRALTLTDALNAMKDAVSSGWMTSYRLFWGELSEAMRTFTGIANRAIVVLDRIKDWRNEVLGLWATGGGRQSIVDILLGDYGKETLEGLYGFIDLIEDAGDFLKDALLDFFRLFVSPDTRQYWGDENYRTAWFASVLLTFTNNIKQTFIDIRDFFNGEVTTSSGEVKTRLQVFSEIVSGISGAVKIGYDLITSLIYFMISLGNRLNPSFEAIINFFNKLGVAIYGAAEETSDSNSIRKFFDVMLEIATPLAEGVNALIIAFTDLLSVLIETDKKEGRTKNIFESLGNFLKTVARIISTVGRPVLTFFRNFFEILTGLIENGFSDDSIRAAGVKLGQSFRQLLAGLLEALPNKPQFVQDWINSLLGIDAVSSADNPAKKTLFDKVSEYISSVTIRIKTLFSNISKNLSIGGVLDSIYEFIKTSEVIQTAIGFFKKANLSQLIIAFLGVSAAISIFRLINAARNAVWTVTGLIQSFRGGVEAGFVPKTKELSEAFINIAKALAIVTASVVVLASIDPGKLIIGVVAIGVILGALFLFAKLLAKMNSSEFENAWQRIGSKFSLAANLMSLALFMASIAVGITLITLAITPLLAMGPDRFAEAVGGIVVMFTAIGLLSYAVISALSNASEKKGTIGKIAVALIAISAAFIVLSAGISAMVLAMAPIAALGWDALWRGLIAVAGIFTIVGLFIGIMMKTMGGGKSGKLLKSTGEIAIWAVSMVATSIALAVSVSALSFALMLLMASLIPLATLKPDDWVRGLLGLMIVLGVLIQFMTTVDKLELKSVNVVGLAAFAYGISVLMDAIKPLANMELGGWAQAMLGLFIVLALLSRFIKSLEKQRIGGEDVSIKIVGLIGFVIGVGILMHEVRMLSKIGWKGLLPGLVGLGGVLLILIGAIKLIQLMQTDDKTLSVKIIGLTSFAIGVSILMLALKGLANTKPEGIGIALIGMMSVMALLLIFLKMLERYEIKMNAKIVGIIGLSAGMWILAQAFISLSDLKAEKVGPALIAFFGICLSLAIFLKAINSFDIKAGTTLTMFLVLLELAGIIIIFAFALDGLTDIDPSLIESFSIGLSAMILSIAGAISILGKLNVGTGVKGILLLAGGIAAILGVITLMIPMILGAIGNGMLDAGSKLKLASGLFSDFIGAMNGISDGDVNHSQSVLDKFKIMLESASGFGKYSGVAQTAGTIIWGLGSSLMSFGWMGSQIQDAGGDTAIKLIKDIAGSAPDLTTISTIDLDLFTYKLVGLAGALYLYAMAIKEVPEGDENNAPDVGRAVQILQELSAGLAAAGGFAIPENMPTTGQLEQFGAELGALALAMVTFEQAGSQLGTGTDKALETLDFFAKTKLKIVEIGAFSDVLDLVLGKEGENTPSKIDAFGNDIADLGNALANFASNTTVVDKETGEIKPISYEAAIDTLDSFVQMNSEIEGKRPAWLEILIGAKGSLSELSGHIEAVGGALQDFSDKAILAVGSKDRKEAVETGIKMIGEIFKIMIRINTSFTTTTYDGLTNEETWYTGIYTDFKILGEDIVSLGGALESFANDAYNAVGTTEKADAVETGVAMLELISEYMIRLENKLPKGESGLGGSSPFWASWFSGTSTNIGGLSEAITTIGGALSSFSSDAVKAVGTRYKTRAITKGIKTLDTIVTFVGDINNRLPRIGGLKAALKTLWEGHQMDILDIANIMGEMGPGLSAFGEAISGNFQSAIDVENAITTIRSLAELYATAAEINTGIDVGLSPMIAAENLTQFVMFLTEGLNPGNTGNWVEKDLPPIIDNILLLMDTLSEWGNTHTSFNGDIITSFRDMAEALMLMSRIDTQKNFEKVGEAIVDGVIIGIGNGNTRLHTAATNMAIAAYNAAMEALRASSPSKLFTEVGTYIPLGMAIGITSRTDSVVDSMNNLTDDTYNTAQTLMTEISRLMTEDLDEEPTITPVIDLSNVRKGISFIDQNLNGGTLNLDTSVPVSLTGQLRGMRTTPAVENQNGIDMNGIYERITSMKNEIANLGNLIKNIKMVTDTGALVGAMTDKMDAALGRKTFYAGRRN